MRRKGNRQSVGDRLFSGLNYLLLTIFFLVCLYPFYYVFIFSISDAKLAARGVGITLLPAGFTLKNYTEVFKLKGMAQSAWISVARTVSGTCLTVVCCAFFGYLVTKPMYLRKTIYRLVVATMYFSSGLIPWYLLLRSYHLTNTFAVYIIPSLLSAYYVILVKTFVEQIPASLEESAMLEGAGFMRIFASIVFPLSLPIIATIAVFAAVGQWNSWFDNYIFVSSNELSTLQLRLYYYLRESVQIAANANKQSGLSEGDSITPEAIRMTVTMVVTLPIVFVYPFMQRYFVKGIMLGAVKG